MLTDGFSIFIAETVGTGLLILLGDGVVGGVLLARSKAQNAGWIVITTGWALAVAFGVYAIGSLTGAHLNPAVTLGFAVAGTTDWGLVPWYIAGEMLGAFIGAVLVYLHYLPHWAETEDPGLKLAVFSTGPAIRNTVSNLISEIIGTFALVFGVYAIVSNELAPGLAALLVGFLVWAIGLSLGGPTGYAINPARDLGPRIAHAILPIAGKGGSDWEYSWIPVVGPIIGGILGAVTYQALFTNFLLTK
ncbi:MAG TPA: MIP/aquaporin family protein [Candidatus Limnocylindria bacterium]|jgi:glycerol uptake facilitator protein|nr:MIP/aquaporin family protein [Candidatus Limnocylindria bacterium]